MDNEGDHARGNARQVAVLMRDDGVENQTVAHCKLVGLEADVCVQFSFDHHLVFAAFVPNPGLRIGGMTIRSVVNFKEVDPGVRIRCKPFPDYAGRKFDPAPLRPPLDEVVLDAQLGC
jgi:hypothetical protein